MNLTFLAMRRRYGASSLFAATSNLALSGIILATNLLSGILIARSLGPEGRGLLTSAIVWPTLVAGVSSLSICDTLVFYITRSHDNKTSQQQYLLAAALTTVFTALLGILIFTIVVLTQYSHSTDKLFPVLLITSGFIPLNHFSQLMVGYFIGIESKFRWNLIRASPHVTYASLCLILWANDLRSTSYFATAFLISNLCTAGIGFRPALLAIMKSTYSKSRVDEILRFAVLLHSGRLISIVRGQLDKVLITIFAAPAQVGIYVVAATFNAVISMITSTLFVQLQPATTKYFNSTSEVEQRSPFPGILLSVGVLGVVTVVGLLVIPVMIPLLFGPEFALAIPPSCNLLVSGMVLGISKLVELILIARKKLQTIAVIEGATVCTTLAFILLDSAGSALEMSRAVLFGSIAGCAVSVIQLIITGRRA